MKFDPDTLEAIRERDLLALARKQGNRAEGTAKYQHDVYPCRRYKMIATPEICQRCKDDPLFKQGLYASYLDGQAIRGNAICRHLGPMMGDRVVGCCGGDKKMVVGIFTCSFLGRKIAEPTCWVCDYYDAK